MKEATYNWIFDQIYESILDIYKKYEKYSTFSFRLAYGKKKAKKVIRNEYEKVRQELKNEIYGIHTDNKKMDRHKIAACFCKALIQRKQYSFVVNDDTPTEVLLSNYELAYVVSLRIVYICRIFLYSTKQADENVDCKKCKNDLIDRGGFEVPETSSSHDEYNKGRIKALAVNDYYGRDFDLLTYADMMYWIEAYNCWIIEGKIWPDKIKGKNN